MTDQNKQDNNDQISREERILIARAKLHPSTQILMTVFDFVGGLLGACIVIAATIALIMATVKPSLLEEIVRSLFL